ncbi:uncharacterized protein LOC111305489 isoform X2 [Durio zibethinus]|uniref:Uncharacterized protein LOC111305489 isoform X2 n=1 Tax=Durio zibethinus TaxID=66656 RepID=A0A6P6A257_DURZI|nr:uncharacterized protein LOC111305489 isoform X2 [Durio zibethinus]
MFFLVEELGLDLGIQVQDFTLRFDILSNDNEREHANFYLCKDIVVYKRALYRCHMICTKLSFLSIYLCCRNTDSCRRQQWEIFCDGRKLDEAVPHRGFCILPLQ